MAGTIEGMISAEPVTAPTLVVLESVPSAVVRHQGVTMATLRPLFDGGFSAIAASGATLAGPAYALYRGDLRGQFDLELGFPVTEPLQDAVTGMVTVEPGRLPAGSALALSHLGAYGSLHEGWGRLGAEAERQGLESSAILEVYVTEPTPETDPTTLRTDLFLLIAAA